MIYIYIYIYREREREKERERERERERGESVIKKFKHLWEHLYDIISNNLHISTILTKTFWKSSTVVLENISVFTGVSLFKNQN